MLMISSLYCATLFPLLVLFTPQFLKWVIFTCFICAGAHPEKQINPGTDPGAVNQLGKLLKLREPTQT